MKAYDGKTDIFLSDDESMNSQNPQLEWEIAVSNFPAKTPQRLSLPVRVEKVFLSSDNMTLIGSVAVANFAFNKVVIARFTLDDWKTTSNVAAKFITDIHPPEGADGYDRFNFNINLADQTNLESKTLFFCVKYCVNGQEYWDNNSSVNFQVYFKKNPKQHNGKSDVRVASSRPLRPLLRGGKKSPPATSGRPKPISVTFDDFPAGSYMNHRLDDFKQHANDCFGNSSTSFGLEGVKSDASTTCNSLALRAQNPIRQAFGSRYDFGASLSAAVRAANSVQADRSGFVSMKLSAEKHGVEALQDSTDTGSNVCMASSEDVNTITVSPSRNCPVSSAAASASSDTDSPLPTDSENHALGSQLHTQLLEEYCFCVSIRSSQLKLRALRLNQFNGGIDEGSPICTTDFASLMYPYHRPSGFSLHDTHKARAVCV